MTTIVLVMMCVAVGALELYAGRQGRDRERAYVRRIDALQDQVTRQNDALATVGERLSAELAKVQRDLLPGLGSRVDDTAGQVAELAGLVRQAEAYVRAQAGRMHDLEQQRVTLAALRRKLGEVEGAVRALDRAGTGAVEGKVDTALDRLADLARGGGEILDLQRTLTRTLEEVEDVVAELLRLTEGELDDAVAGAVTGRTPAAVPVRATGRLWTRDDQVRDILAEVYERAVRASGLEIRFRADNAARRRYFFGGRRVEDLGGTFTALLISTGADLRSGARPAGLARAPEDEASLKALLRTVFECTGAVAQIGPLLTVRTREELLCAVLTPDQGLELENDELYFDPAAAAQRLRLLPPHQVWDLTAWGARA
ncbi:hypothetical protein BTM25_31290 [Actinomadura rubteroloni]|uniref:Uncharacterized protein n=1 Tax=Actinomadura rubteroloni TaxID=1926885 RepID=A0A2P4UHI5_9ACTN|nr:hypothetical protein [Actinomadura rubteroloni]POM24500.1 hypothetical protein BTM25_31290 [Actinomadura rubteroloni]